jgi:tetratricopeptide (TPR) repeat protein
VTQQALAAYYQGLEAEESVAGVRTLARLYQDLDQSEKAIQLFEERIRQGEQEKWVPSLLAQYYVGLGDAYLDGLQVDQAITAYRHAVNLDGWWPGARLALARGLSEQGDQAGAMAETQRAVEVAPGSVETQLALAGTLDQAGDAERALAIYQETAQAHRGSAPANLALARAWQEHYRWDLAEQSYQQALAMVPGETEAYVGLANLIVLQARYAEAESLLRQALEVDRSDVVLHLRLGDLLARQARHAEALDAYQQAEQASPADWQA